MKTRVVEHPYRKDAGLRIENKRHKPYADPGGRGTQIVREQVVCPECARKG